MGIGDSNSSISLLERRVRVEGKMRVKKREEEGKR